MGTHPLKPSPATVLLPLRSGKSILTNKRVVTDGRVARIGLAMQCDAIRCDATMRCAMQCDARIVVAKGFDGEQECSCRRTFFRFSKGMTTPLETLPNSSTLNSPPQSEQITQNTDGLFLSLT